MDEYYFYVIKKLPVLEGETQRLESYLDATLQNMKYDEYMETLEGWGSGLDVRYNNAALAACSVSKLKMAQEQLEAASSESSSSQVPEESQSSAPEESSSESSSQG